MGRVEHYTLNGTWLTPSSTGQITCSLFIQGQCQRILGISLGMRWVAPWRYGPWVSLESLHLRKLWCCGTSTSPFPLSPPPLLSLHGPHPASLPLLDLPLCSQSHPFPFCILWLLPQPWFQLFRRQRTLAWDGGWVPRRVGDTYGHCPWHLSMTLRLLGLACSLPVTIRPVFRFPKNSSILPLVTRCTHTSLFCSVWMKCSHWQIWKH